MIKKLFSLFTLIALLTLMVISCKSTPASDAETASGQTTTTAGSGTTSGQTTTTPGSETTPGQTTTTSGSGTASGQTPPAIPIPAALLEAIKKVEEARERAFDFESPIYLPGEWEAVEKQYVDAGKAPYSTPGEIQQAAALYEAAAAAYDELYREAVPLYAQGKRDEILSVREELIKAGITDLFPQYLQDADDIAFAAWDQYNDGDYYKAKDTAAAALNEYEDLYVGAALLLARQEIIDNDFVMYSPEDFEMAEEAALAAKAEYEAGNKEKALAMAEEALHYYNTVLENGWTHVALNERIYAESERELAIAERANIATRDIFNEADSLYDRGGWFFVRENFKSAASFYVESKELFTVARLETEEKRLKALEGMRLADEKIGESGETALEAERIIEGGSR